MTTSRRKFRNGAYPFGGLFLIAILAIAYVDMLVGAESGTDVAVSSLLCAASMTLAFRSFLWTAVIAEAGGVLVRNPFRTLRFTWGEVNAFRAEDRVIIETADGVEVRCWAVQRANIARILKRRSYVDAVVDDLRVMREQYLGSGR